MRKLSMDELNRLNEDEFKREKKFPLVLVLDNVRSMHNTGSIFRTADAFRLEKIYLCGITACPPHREIEKTALGATKSVNWKYFENTKDAVLELKNQGFKIACIEQVEGSMSLLSFQPHKNEKYAVIFGNEVKGVQENVLELCDYFLEIPQFGTKHSFNVSVTAGIVVWDFYSKISPGY